MQTFPWIPRDEMPILLERPATPPPRSRGSALDETNLRWGALIAGEFALVLLACAAAAMI